MSVFGIGLAYGIVTLLVMFSGMPIAFALGAVAVVFMAIFMPSASLDTVTQNVYEEMASITLLSIPLFILKGAAIGKSRAGQDLYLALHAWLHRVPGGLGVANVFACALFAAMAGSSPATCSAIGSAGIPEMRKRGYSGGFAAGIIAAGGTLGILLPPSITMILFAVAAEKSLGRLFLAGIGPGLLLVTLFGIYAVVRFRQEYAAAEVAYKNGGPEAPILHRDEYTLAERFSVLPRVIPFVLLLTGVMVALYGGYATPSETAGLGGLLALALIAAIYSVWRPSDLAPIMKSTIRESTMLMMIIGMSLLYSYVMSYLHISQSVAESIVAMHLPRWELLFAILVMVVVLGFFLPPVSHHPDDGTDHPAAAPRRQFRHHLVRRRHDHRDGDGADPPAGRPQHLRHPQRRARYSPARGDLGYAALRALDDACSAAAVPGAGDFDLAAGPRDGAGREQVEAIAGL
ncbi:tripartite ATP-independent transporter DctM subunit [Bradyrhizobium yuanmingense]